MTTVPQMPAGSPAIPVPKTGRPGPAGLGYALLAAGSFATSGTFGAALLAAGWSPAAAVAARVLVAAVVLTPPAIRDLRGRWGLLRRSIPLLIGFGALAVAACQLCYFIAIERLDVGVALMLEYLAGVFVVLWLWLRHGQRPGPLTAVGAVTALAGLALVLDVTGGVRLDPVGVFWALCAALGCAVFFVVSARAAHLPPLVLAWAGMVVGGVLLVVLGLVGAVPLRASTADVVLLDRRTSWLVPVLGLALVAAVVSYLAGIAAARSLGARVASFVGLTEVIFAVLFAWLLLGQLPGPSQLVGGAVIVLGVALVRLGEPPTADPGANTPPEVAESA